MIIQQYDFSLTSAGRPIYRGETTFGFFSKPSLANQVGIRDAKIWHEPVGVDLQPYPFPDGAPFPDGRWGMIDRVEADPPAGRPAWARLDRRDQAGRPRGVVLRRPFPPRSGLPGVVGFGILPATP